MVTASQKRQVLQTVRADETRRLICAAIRTNGRNVRYKAASDFTIARHFFALRAHAA